MSFPDCVTVRAVRVPLLRLKSDRRTSPRVDHDVVRPCTWCGGASEFLEAGVAGADTLPREPAWACRAPRCGSLEFVRHHHEAGAAIIDLWIHGRWSCQLIRGSSEVLLLAHSSAVLTRVCASRADVERAALRFQIIAQLADARRSLDSPA